MLTATIESVTAALDANEIQPMFPAHWLELGIFQDRMKLDPEYSLYRAHDAAGQIVYVALRSAGECVGYFVGFVTPGLHYKTTLTCKMDIAYVKPEHRGGGGRILFDAVKAELKRRGVKIWWVGSKDHHPIEAFYEALGFERQETYFTMWLGAEDA